jgi:DUF4097 and DUF4098 domain-containing protein YvlB
MNAVTVTLVAALAAAPQAQERPDSRTPQTDQTVAVQRGARLLIDNFAGDVEVRAWDRDSLRVQARHASRARVSVRTLSTGIRVSSSAERGPVGSVDYEITAPAWMPIRIEGQFSFITVEGSQAEVSAETVRGDVVIRGGNGVIAKSVEGNVTIEGARGRINVSSVNEGIVIDGAAGEIAAETVNGPITMSRIESASVEAGTINGNISYEGSAANGGRYRLTSHNGNLTVGVPETSNATFTVRTYNGGFNSNLPVKGESERGVRQGRRVVFTLGNGSAEFELETFSGSIRLRKPGTMPPARSKDKGL